MKLKLVLTLVVIAVLGAPLWSQSTPDPLAQLAGTTGTFNDTMRGVSATCPVGWSIKRAERWGNNETTIFLKASNAVSSSPSLYYKPRPADVPAADGIKAYLMEEARKKVVLRVTNGLPDYANRPNGFVFRTINGHPALSWMADFTRDGKKYSECLTRVIGDETVALFFMMANDWEVEALKPEFDSMIATIKLP